MCELLAISARFPTTIHLSLDELARHGGATGPHRDGWGVAYLEDGDALVLREPDAASGSRLLACAKHTTSRSATVIAHVRRATQGPRMLRNTQPFTRELGGRLHVFAHNGMLPGIEVQSRFATTVSTHRRHRLGARVLRAPRTVGAALGERRAEPRRSDGRSGRIRRRGPLARSGELHLHRRGYRVRARSLSER